MDIKFHCSEEANFTLKGQLVKAFSYKDYFIEPHNHDFYEMNIILSGGGLHQIESATFSVKRGDVFVIPPMTSHAYFNTSGLEVYHILLKNDFVKEKAAEAADFPGFLQLMEIEPFLRRNCSEAMFLHLTPKQLMEIQGDLKIIEGREAYDPRTAPLSNHTAWKIIYQLSYLLHEQGVSSDKTEATKYRHQILDTLEYLHQHLSEKITVSSLAARVFLSRSTFLRSFQAVCGCSPIQYLNRYRTKKAIELSKNSSMSKTEIAHFCGFYDLSHMERSIKKNKRK